MSGIATAVVGGALIGAVGSSIAAGEAAGAAESAAGTQAEAARYGTDVQREMFEETSDLLRASRQPGYTANPLLEYLTTGIMPEMTAQDMSELSGLQSPGEEGLSRTQQIRLNELTGRQRAIQSARGGMQGLIEESPMYQFQRDIGEKNLQRRLSAMGRGSSTFGMNAFSDFNRGLLASESDKIYGRLIDQANIARGAATSTGAAGMQAGAGMAGTMQAAGNAMAGGQLAAGQQRASLYSNLGAMPMQAYGNYQMLNAMQQPTQQPYQNPYVTSSNPMGLTPGQGL